MARDNMDRRVDSTAVVDLLLAPNLRTSSMKASRILKEWGGGYDILLLNVPMEMEGILRELAAEHISCDELIDEARRLDLIPEPSGSWDYFMRPIFEALPRIAETFPDIDLGCYGSREDEHASMEVSVRAARLILRTILTGEVEVDRWRETLRASLEVDERAAGREAEIIIRKVGKRTICLSGLGGRRLKESLNRAGIDVKICYVEENYHFTPLSILKRKMARGFVMNEELDELVRLHVEYVRGYIYRFRNRDRAHYEWEYDRVPWLRRRIKKEEIGLLDSLINEYRSTE